MVANLPAATLETLLKQPGQEGVLWFNAGAADDALRQSRCRPNLLHTCPGRAMRADALAQYPVARRWKKMVSGDRPAAGRRRPAAVRRAAKLGGADCLAKNLAPSTTPAAPPRPKRPPSAQVAGTM